MQLPELVSRQAGPTCLGDKGLDLVWAQVSVVQHLGQQVLISGLGLLGPRSFGRTVGKDSKSADSDGRASGTGRHTMAQCGRGPRSDSGCSKPGGMFSGGEGASRNSQSRTCMTARASASAECPFSRASPVATR